MIINGKEISMMPGRIYHIDDIVLEDMYLKFTRPILINYIVDLEEQDYLDRVTVAKREFAQLGQIAGVFTENKDILNNYQFFRNNDSVIVNEDYNYSYIIELHNFKSKKPFSSQEATKCFKPKGKFFGSEKLYLLKDLEKDGFINEKGSIIISCYIKPSSFEELNKEVEYYAKKSDKK